MELWQRIEQSSAHKFKNFLGTILTEEEEGIFLLNSSTAYLILLLVLSILAHGCFNRIIQYARKTLKCACHNHHIKMEEFRQSTHRSFSHHEA